MSLQGFTLFNNPTVYGFWYEIGIIVILIVFLVMIYRKYLVKRHKLTLILFDIFLCFLIAVITSWLSKLLQVFYLEFSIQWEDPLTVFSIPGWFFVSIWNFRYPMIMATVAALLSNTLKVQAFQEKPKPVYVWFIRIYAIISIAFSLIFFEDGVFNTPIAFLLVFVYMLIIYITFMRRALIVRTQVSDPKAKSAFASLAFMAFCFIMIFLCFFIDQVLVVVIRGGFTIFYFLAWSWSILAVLSAYFGYISPRRSRTK